MFGVLDKAGAEGLYVCAVIAVVLEQGQLYTHTYSQTPTPAPPPARRTPTKSAILTYLCPSMCI